MKSFLASLILFSFTYVYPQIQWQENGIPVRQGDNIRYYATVSCEDGSFVSVWVDNRNGYRGLYAQKVDLSGGKLWGETGLEIYNPDRKQSE